jgi:hypothetical protein
LDSVSTFTSSENVLRMTMSARVAGFHLFKLFFLILVLVLFFVYSAGCIRTFVAVCGAGFSDTLTYPTTFYINLAEALV